MKNLAKINLNRCRPALGTFVCISIANDSEQFGITAIELAYNCINRIDRLMSVHSQKSDITTINRTKPGLKTRVHKDTFEVLERAMMMYEKTQGLFNPAVGQHLQSKGFIPDFRRSKLSPKPTPQPMGIGYSLDRHTGSVQRTHSSAQLDLGGIAKGYAVDRAVDVLMRNGITEGVVNAGGDLRVFGPRKVQFKIRSPFQPTQPIHSITIKNRALATSGSYFSQKTISGKVTHPIVNPQTGESVEGLCSVTIESPECWMADALTKVVSMELKSSTPLLKHFNSKAYIVSSDFNTCE
ncbi:MAG: FAD:protein FMN transferase [Verrucomicrobiota bacterium]|nr:FAD:protein FMN transferase [Verrucomicrobiota bacterium]